MERRRVIALIAALGALAVAAAWSLYHHARFSEVLVRLIFV